MNCDCYFLRKYVYFCTPIGTIDSIATMETIESIPLHKLTHTVIPNAHSYYHPDTSAASFRSFDGAG